jgi:ankyrin repeat protein
LHESVKATDEEERRYAELQGMALDFARNGDTDTLASMVEAGLPVNLADEKGNTLLMLAAYHGNEGTLRMLLRHGADPERKNARGQTPLAGAAFKGDAEIARLLIDGGAKADTPCAGGQRPIQFAAMFGNRDVYRLLLEHGGGNDRTKICGIPARIVVGMTSGLRGCIKRRKARR